MKKFIFFLSAIALLGLASCTEPQQVNPNFNPETNEVKTAFAFNIMTNAQTKATANDVQFNGGNFLGMEQMFVYAFALNETAVGPLDETVTATSYSLGSLSSNDISSSQSSKIYNLSIKTGTDNMVFYGKAINNNYGAISAPTQPLSATGALSAVKWALVGILGTQDFGTPANTIATKLNNLVIADWKTAASFFNDVNNANHTRKADYATLTDLYNNLMTVNDVRQGSGPAVCAMIKDLYNAVKLYEANASTEAITGNSAIASPKSIATAILSAINSNFTVSSTTGVVSVSLGTDDLNKFPTNLGLPAGSAQLVLDNDGNFEYATAPEAFENATVSTVDKFMKPAALYYWVNSPLRVSSYESLTVDDYPTTTAAWAAGASTWSSYANWQDNGKVSADTRGVAIKNNIQYATAMLKTTVQYKDATLKDNTEHFMLLRGDDVTKDQEFKIIDNPFELNGIIIGGQPKNVAWNWVPTTKATENDYVIYDVTPTSTSSDQRKLPTTAGQKSSEFYTLVLDNYNPDNSSDAKQATVAVALELVNKTGKSFWGKENLIPAGGTFYLVGSLDPAALAGTTFTKNPNTRAPHLTDSDFVPRIFMQDYYTSADFVIDEKSLKYAYSTIPDLRSTMMTFGISVDLQWLAGGTFDVNLTPSGN